MQCEEAIRGRLDGLRLAYNCLAKPDKGIGDRIGDLEWVLEGEV